MDARKESWIGCLLLYGAVAFFGGCILTGILSFAGVLRFQASQEKDIGMLLFSAVGPCIAFAGMIAVAVGLISGFAKMRGGSRGEGRTVSNVRIMAAYGYSEHNQIVFHDFDQCAINGKLAVRVHFPDGTNDELYCNLPTHQCCGEGMLGTARIQGNWLGEFVANPPGQQGR